MPTQKITLKNTYETHCILALRQHTLSSVILGFSTNASCRKVIDAKDKSPLPYANIRIKEKP